MPKLKRRKYTNESLRAALRAISEEHLSLKEAEKVFGVPKSTLCDKIKGNVLEQVISGELICKFIDICL